MKIQFVQSAAGNDVVYGKGQVIELPDDQARGFVVTGLAVMVENEQKKERAIDKTPREKR